jgi:TonB family protein
MPKIKTATRSPLRLWMWATALPLLATVLTLAAAPVRSQTGKPDPAEAAAAMQRAERIASNPMRIILQAGKINRKPGADESAPTPAPIPAAAPRAPAPVLVASVATVSSNANTQRPAPEPTAEPAPVAAEAVYKADARMKATAPAAFAPLSAGEAPSLINVVALSAAAPSLMSVADAAAPKLKRMVEVEVPRNVLDLMSRGQEVMVKFTVAADGSVSDVNLQAPAPRQLARYVQAAVSQWQFEPMAAARSHAVQLVFNVQ